MTTQKQIRAAFWNQHPEFTRRGQTKQNDYNATIRTTWCDFIDQLERAGTIRHDLADRATL